MNNWEAVSREDPVSGISRKILYVCSYCAPDAPLPIGLIKQTLQPLGKVEDTDLDQGMRLLVDSDIIQLKQGKLIIKAEIAKATRDQDAILDQRIFPSLAGTMIDLSYQTLVNGTQEDRQLLQPHLHCIALASQTALPEKAGALWNNLGTFLRLAGENEEARFSYEQALACEQTALGPEHPKVADRYNNLGNILQVMGDLVGARLYFEKALSIDKKSFGEDHPKLAIRLNRLGSLLRAQGDKAGAIEYCERALTIDKKALGESHPDVGIDLHDLGRLLMESGDLSRARVCLEQALGIFEKYYPGDHRYIQIVRMSLSTLDKIAKG